jgi:P-loop Domain of unknown function (DUF2791)
MTLEARTAIEALRAGVPNRAAIRQMGTEQTAIEHAFDAALQGAWHPSAQPRRGLGIAGGFGTGKSHLLGYLAEAARLQGFVVSRVVISKETPLSHPGHVFAAAVRDAMLPDRPDDPIAACASALRERPDELDGLEDLVAAPEAGFAPVFAAALFLLRRSSTPVDVLRRLERFFAGAKLSTAAVRPALTAAGAGRAYSLKMPAAADVIGQTIRFVPHLFRAAGYAGWCILLDEVELIGRYTPLQRGLSYAQLAVWLGLDAARGFPGIVAAYAVTDDFAVAVIDARQDHDKLAARLRLKGRLLEADLAEAGMSHIERTVREHRLLPPTVNDLAACHDKVRRLYGTAYGWTAPALPPAERISSRTMRQYIKGWITQWDLLRLDGTAVSLVSGTIASNYAEDDGLWEPATLADETE